MEKKELIYKATRSYVENGITCRVHVTAKLADECNNGVCSFSVTADVYEIKGPGRPRYAGGGCCHDEVLKAFPKLRPVVDLHLCNYLGQPLYPVENGMYWYRESQTQGMNYSRVKSFITGAALEQAALSGDKQYYTYLLFSLGVVDAWKAEADAAIQLLQDLTGDTWVNPYDSPRFTLQPLSVAESAAIAAKIDTSYYHPAAIAARIEEAEAEKAAKLRADLASEYDKKVERIEEEKNVVLYLFDTFGARVAENAIYYGNGKIGLNWRSYSNYLAPEEVENVQKSFDFARFPYITTIEDQRK